MDRKAEVVEVRHCTAGGKGSIDVQRNKLNLVLGYLCYRLRSSKDGVANDACLIGSRMG